MDRNIKAEATVWPHIHLGKQQERVLNTYHPQGLWILEPCAFNQIYYTGHYSLLGTGLRSNQKAVDYPHNFHDTIALLGIVSYVAFRTQHCIIPLVTFLSQLCILHSSTMKGSYEERSFHMTSVCPSTKVCSVVESYHLVIVGNQEQWKYSVVGHGPRASLTNNSEGVSHPLFGRNNWYKH